MHRYSLQIFTALFAGAIIAGCSSDESDDSGEAAMFRGNLERTGVYPDDGPTDLTELVWKFKSKDIICSSPAVSGGAVYFGSYDGYLYKVK